MLLNRRTISSAENHTGKGLALLLFAALYAMAIFQDYIEAQLKLFQFYWSESMLYNTYLFFFIPMLWAGSVLSKRYTPHTLRTSVAVALLFGVACTFLHLYLFAQVFVWASELLYPIPHRFTTILHSATSSYTYPTLFVYVLTPIALRSFNGIRTDTKAMVFKTYSDLLSIRQGRRIVPVPVSTILAITASRPYSEIAVADKTYLHNASLKKLMEALDPTIFIRVHRSALVNKHHIAMLHSRKNGDYDAVLTNGQTLRFSRHYRQNWDALIIH